MDEKEVAINDLADDLSQVRSIVAEKEKKLEELEERHSKLADYYEKDNANIKKYNQELSGKQQAFVDEIKQLRWKLDDKEKLIENLKRIAQIKAKEMPKKPQQDNTPASSSNQVPQTPQQPPAQQPPAQQKGKDEGKKGDEAKKGDESKKEAEGKKGGEGKKGEGKKGDEGGKGAGKGKDHEQGKEGKGPGDHKEEKYYRVSKFVHCGSVWEFNSDTQQYKCYSKSEDGAARIKGAVIKGRDDWYRVIKVYKDTGKWLNDAQKLEAYLEAEKEDEIEKRVQERLRAKEEEQAWRSTSASNVDDDDWDWDGPPWSNEQKEITEDKRRKKHRQWDEEDDSWWSYDKEKQQAQ